MRTYERNGVTVDQCSECRGIFLDRGELERLVDAEQAWHGSGQREAPQQPTYEQPSYGGNQPQYGEHGGHYGKPRKKKRSFMDDLFD